MIHNMIKGIFIVSVLLLPKLAISTPFDSGSTGADGVFAPTTDTILTLPPDGEFNFTTVNVPLGVTVTFIPNVLNTPVTILATGDVTVDGAISLNGEDGASVDGATLLLPIGRGGPGGPGGFAGGSGGLAPPWNGGNLLGAGWGLGPGGGGISDRTGCGGDFGTKATLGESGLACHSNDSYGAITLLPLIGGSGGIGGRANSSNVINCTNGCNGGGAGGGGGAILIASSGTIAVNGSILANGGSGGNGYFPGGAGSGGGIRLIANEIKGAGAITAHGGTNASNHSGGAGRIRLETNTFSFSGTVNPAPTISIPGLVALTSNPTLSITAIAGVPVPSTATGSLDSPDITLPSSNPSSVTVNLAAFNIPVDTIVKIFVTPRDRHTTSYNSTALSGTEASSTATATVDLSSTQTSVIRAEVTFAVQTASNGFPMFAGDEKVERVRVASNLGSRSSVSLITETGKEIPWP